MVVVFVGNNNGDYVSGWWKCSSKFDWVDKECLFAIFYRYARVL